VALIVGIVLYFVYPGLFDRRLRDDNENQPPVNLAQNVPPFDLEDNRQRESADRLAAQQDSVATVDPADVLYPVSTDEKIVDDSAVEASVAVSTPTSSEEIMGNNETSNVAYHTAIVSKESHEEVVVSDPTATVVEKGTDAASD